MALGRIFGKPLQSGKKRFFRTIRITEEYGQLGIGLNEAARQPSGVSCEGGIQRLSRDASVNTPGWTQRLANTQEGVHK